MGPAFFMLIITSGGGSSDLQIAIPASVFLWKFEYAYVPIESHYRISRQPFPLTPPLYYPIQPFTQTRVLTIHMSAMML